MLGCITEDAHCGIPLSRCRPDLQSPFAHNTSTMRTCAATCHQSTGSVMAAHRCASRVPHCALHAGQSRRQSVNASTMYPACPVVPGGQLFPITTEAHILLLWGPEAESYPAECRGSMQQPDHQQAWRNRRCWGVSLLRQLDSTPAQERQADTPRQPSSTTSCAFRCMRITHIQSDARCSISGHLYECMSPPH
jgi:hypothetical protein